MRNLTTPVYENSIFINCPFDEQFQPLLRAIVFTAYSCGFHPISALAEQNSMDNRLDKIFRLIEQCKFGIHDISRIELTQEGLPRFNMPFELGVFFGAKRFGNRNQRLKNALIFEKTKYLYQKYLSDINGVDIITHEGIIENVIVEVRNWLLNTSDTNIVASPLEIINSFKNFTKKLDGRGLKLGFNEYYDFPFKEFSFLIKEYLFDHPT